ncbi:MAG: hypothetical protein H6837_00025 [Planctomycetes bacterium]|nr:hypothetical protein [Planctomycetota bacterium]
MNHPCRCWIRSSAARTAAALTLLVAVPAQAELKTIQEGLRDADSRIRITAIERAGGLGDEAAPLLPALLRFLRAGPQAERSAAVGALIRLGGSARPAVAELSRCLREAGPVRGAAHLVLAALAETESEEDWIADLKTADDRTRTRVLGKLAEVEKPSAALLSAVVRVLAEPRLAPSARMTLLALAGRAVPAIPELLRLVEQTEDRTVRRSCLVLARDLGVTPAEGLGMVRRMLPKADSITRYALLDLLGSFAATDRDAFDTVLDMLQRGARVRRYDMMRVLPDVLRNPRRKELVSAIASLLDESPGFYLQREALRGLGDAVTPLIPVLLAKLDARIPAPLLRGQLEALVDVGPQAAAVLPKLVAVAADPDPIMARLALRGARRCGKPGGEVDAILSAGLGHPDATVRRDAVLSAALVEDCGVAVRALVRGRLDDRVGAVQDAAELALLCRGAAWPETLKDDDAQDAKVRAKLAALRKQAADPEFVAQAIRTAARSDPDLVRMMALRHAFGPAQRGTAAHHEFVATCFRVFGSELADAATDHVCARVQDDPALLPAVLRSTWLVSRAPLLRMVAARGDEGIVELVRSLTNNVSQDPPKLQVLVDLRAGAAPVRPVLEALLPEAQSGLVGPLRAAIEAVPAPKEGTAVPMRARTVVLKWRLRRLEIRPSRAGGSAPGRQRLDEADAMAALGSDDPELVGLAIRLVRKLPMAQQVAAVPRLEVLTTSDQEVSVAAMEALRAIARSRRRVPLPPAGEQRFAADPRSRIREALRQRWVRGVGSVPMGAILRGLEDPAPGMRLAALDAGEEIIDEAFWAQRVGALLEDRVPAVRYQALHVLSRHPTAAASALPALARIVEDPSVTSNVDLLLLKIGAEALPLLTKRLRAELAGLHSRRRSSMMLLANVHQLGAAARPLLPLLLEAARSESPQGRAYATHALGSLGVATDDPAFAAIREVFLKCLSLLSERSDGMLATRTYAGLQALGKSGSFAVSAVVPVLQDLVSGYSSESKRIELLVKLGAPAEVLLPQMKGLLERTDRSANSAKPAVAMMLGALGPRCMELFDVVFAARKDRNATWLPEALVQLAPFCDAERAKQLVTHVLSELPRRSSRSFRNIQALAALGAHGVDALLSTLDGPNAWAASQVIRTMAAKQPALLWARRKQLGPAHLAALLEGIAAAEPVEPWMAEAAVAHLDDPGHRVKTAAFRLLARQGRAAVPVLRARLANAPEHAWDLLSSTQQLGIRGAEFVPALVTLYRAAEVQRKRLDDPREVKQLEARQRALLQSLPRYGPKGVVALEMLGIAKDRVEPLLIGALSSSHMPTRIAAARALVAVQSRSPRAARALRTMMRSKNAGERRWGMVGFLGVMPELKPSNDQVESVAWLLANADAKVRSRVIRAAGSLSAWGDDLLALLVLCLSDPDREVAAAARSAIEKWGAAGAKAQKLL